ncbi:hypothetical protein [Pseudonocardia acaciae]|uniref:hypothetical protein n=1 Tax=Pseudonocardia acaciae TaxID=551276 RepID=UPI0012EDC907|nr:hypothetical protein [Pseudonocardia acaciae]
MTMRILFEITGSDGSVIATGCDSTRTTDLSSWDNHSSVVRLLRARAVTPQLGQKLVMWVEAGPPVPIGRRWS